MSNVWILEKLHDMMQNIVLKFSGRGQSEHKNYSSETMSKSNEFKKLSVLAQILGLFKKESIYMLKYSFCRMKILVVFFLCFAASFSVRINIQTLQ